MHLSNIADLIEEYILRKLSQENSSKVELRRTEIADEIECAPSQISYVLNTRFTAARGFTVESRRGLGGFIRITRVPIQKMIYRDILRQIDDTTTFEQAEAFIRSLLQHQMVRRREAVLATQLITLAFERTEQERVKLLRMVFLTLADFA